jgi:mannobiose 2-epimerase
MSKMKEEMQDVLENNILKYWIEHVTDNVQGGYYGRIDGHDQVYPDAEKGAILNARILWAFSAAYRVLQKKEYLLAAERAKKYIIDHFYDKEYGGVYWSLDAKGQPLDTKKQIYAIGFTIYGMSEYARATGDKEALDMAIRLYHDIEDHAFDKENNGYVEALTRDWQPIADMRLSDKDENGSRTMNTHLHIIEPYTNLYRVWKDDGLKASICNLLDIFTDKLLNPQTHHLDLFFDDQWNGKRNIQSFGHDIEASWLLHETALVLGDEQILKKIENIIPQIAKAADEGLQPDGSMIYERWTDSDRMDTQRQWWVMCENVIGHVDLYQYFGDEAALEVAQHCWDFIKDNLIDWQRGEWHWSVDEKGAVNYDDDKAGFWKCPYHNSRMCLEIMERL